MRAVGNERHVQTLGAVACARVQDYACLRWVALCDDVYATISMRYATMPMRYVTVSMHRCTPTHALIYGTCSSWSESMVHWLRLEDTVEEHQQGRMIRDPVSRYVLFTRS